MPTRPDTKARSNEVGAPERRCVPYPSVIEGLAGEGDQAVAADGKARAPPELIFGLVIAESDVDSRQQCVEIRPGSQQRSWDAQRSASAGRGGHRVEILIHSHRLVIDDVVRLPGASTLQSSDRCVGGVINMDRME